MNIPVGRSRLFILAASIGFGLSMGATAQAHVIVSPKEATTTSYQTFTVAVPNEKQTPTTSVKVMIPKGAYNITPTQKEGWRITIEREGEGDAEAVKSITWDEGTIGEGLRDEFTFSAKMPESAMDLQWKAYQTYADGSVVSWDKNEEVAGHDNGTTGPASMTHVVEEASSDVVTRKIAESVADTKSVADRAMIFGVIGILVGLLAVYLATGKKK